MCALVDGLGGDGDRYDGRIDAADTAAGRVDIGDGVGGVWGCWGRYLEAAGHGRGGGSVVCCAKNGKKRALSSKKSQVRVRTNGVQNHHGGIKSIGTLVKAR
eukprot:scaffold248351_cov96-Cyclotella_meneghiniana.AAC.1